MAMRIVVGAGAVRQWWWTGHATGSGRVAPRTTVTCHLRICHPRIWDSFSFFKQCLKQSLNLQAKAKLNSNSQFLNLGHRICQFPSILNLGFVFYYRQEFQEKVIQFDDSLT
jgi:hypothetical protein